MIDREALLTITEGNRELLADLVQLFRTEGPRLVREMRDAIATSDAAVLRRAAHTLAGNARMFSAPKLAETAREVERVAVAGDLANASQRLPEIEAAVGDLCSGLAELNLREAS